MLFCSGQCTEQKGTPHWLQRLDWAGGLPSSEVPVDFAEIGAPFGHAALARLVLGQVE